MKTLWRCWCAIVFALPVFVGVLAVFYALAIFISTFHRPETPRLALILAGVATAGLFGLATERIQRYGRVADELRIPRHEQWIHRVQLLMLALLVALPVAITWLEGGPWLFGAAALTVAAAFGVLIVRGNFIVFVFFVIAQFTDLKPWLERPPVLAVAFVIAMWVLWRWYASLKPAPERRMIPRTPSGADDPPIVAEGFDVTSAVAELRAGKISTAAVGVGLGFGSRISPLTILQAIAIVLGVVLVWHWIRQSRPENAAYFLITGYAAITILSQHAAMYLAWKHSRGEQELLLLMPRCPPFARLKLIFLIALARTLVLPWVVWAAVSAVVGVIGWVSLPNIVFAGAMLLAGSLTLFTFAAFAIRPQLFPLTSPATGGYPRP